MADFSAFFICIDEDQAKEFERMGFKAKETGSSNGIKYTVFYNNYSLERISNVNYDKKNVIFTNDMNFFSKK